MLAILTSKQMQYITSAKIDSFSYLKAETQSHRYIYLWVTTKITPSTEGEKIYLDNCTEKTLELLGK